MPNKLEKLKSDIKEQLKQDYPEISEQDLNEQVNTIVNLHLEKEKKKLKESENDKFDEDGRYIVSENTKFYIEAGINSIEE